MPGHWGVSTQTWPNAVKMSSHLCSCTLLWFPQATSMSHRAQSPTLQFCRESDWVNIQSTRNNYLLWKNYVTFLPVFIPILLRRLHFLNIHVQPFYDSQSITRASLARTELVYHMVVHSFTNTISSLNNSKHQHLEPPRSPHALLRIQFKWMHSKHLLNHRCCEWPEVCRPAM